MTSSKTVDCIFNWTNLVDTWERFQVLACNELCHHIAVTSLLGNSVKAAIQFDSPCFPVRPPSCDDCNKGETSFFRIIGVAEPSILRPREVTVRLSVPDNSQLKLFDAEGVMRNAAERTFWITPIYRSKGNVGYAHIKSNAHMVTGNFRLPVMAEITVQQIPAGRKYHATIYVEAAVKSQMSESNASHCDDTSIGVKKMDDASWLVVSTALKLVTQDGYNWLKETLGGYSAPQKIVIKGRTCSVAEIETDNELKSLVICADREVAIGRLRTKVSRFRAAAIDRDSLERQLPDAKTSADKADVEAKLIRKESELREIMEETHDTLSTLFGGEISFSPK